MVSMEALESESRDDGQLSEPQQRRSRFIYDTNEVEFLFRGKDESDNKGE